MKFDELIGQDRAKERLKFYFESFQAGEAFPTLIFVGQKGNGKTALAQASALHLNKSTNGIKRAMTVNCSAIKNLKQFWNSVIVPVVNDRDVTLFMDEASELPTDVTMALLTMINPNAENRNSFTYADFTVDVDLKRQTFMFATTEPQSVFHALMNRCRRIDLEPYSYDELAKILKRHCPHVTFGKGVLEAIAPTLRGNARKTVLLAQDIKSYLAPLHKHAFNVDDWAAFSKRLDVLPLGISRNELAVLRILQARKDTSLTRLAATLGMTPQAVRQDCELYLMAAGLMEITTGGRNITPQGQAILKQIDNKH